MQIRRFNGYWTKRKGYKGVTEQKSAPKPGTYGLGLILGGCAACFGRECGATRAELLAIFDDPRQNKILVRYYKRLGFKEVRDVGDSLQSIGDRLVTLEPCHEFTLSSAENFIVPIKLLPSSSSSSSSSLKLTIDHLFVCLFVWCIASDMGGCWHTHGDRPC